jgi:hypothetical protein
MKIITTHKDQFDKNNVSQDIIKKVKVKPNSSLCETLSKFIYIYIYIYGTIEEEENIFLVAINAFAPFIESKVHIFFNLQKGFDGYGLYLPWVTNDGDR